MFVYYNVFIIVLVWLLRKLKMSKTVGLGQMPSRFWKIQQE